MFGKVFGEDENIVKIDRDLSFGDEVTEDIVHHPLEGGGWVGESEEHDSGFEQSSVHVEGSFFLVAFFDLDVVVSPTNVKLREELCTTKLVNEFGDQG